MYARRTSRPITPARVSAACNLCLAEIGTALADERAGEPVGGVVGLPAEEVLRAEPAVVHPVLGASPHPDDAPVLDGDVEPVAVGVQDRRGLDPAVHLVWGHALLEVRVHADGLLLPGSVRRPRAPRLGDAIKSRHAPDSPSWRSRAATSERPTARVPQAAGPRVSVSWRAPRPPD